MSKLELSVGIAVGVLLSTIWSMPDWKQTMSRHQLNTLTSKMLKSSDGQEHLSEFTPIHSPQKLQSSNLSLLMFGHDDDQNTSRQLMLDHDAHCGDSRNGTEVIFQN